MNINVTKKNDGSYTVVSDNFSFESSDISLFLTGDKKLFLDFKDEYENKSFSYGTLKGILKGDISSNNDIEVKREFFFTDDNSSAAIRVIVKNLQDKPIFLDKILPVHIPNNDSIRVANAPFSDWRALRMAQQKNENPGSYRPGTLDRDYEDVIFSSEGLIAGGGVVWSTVDTSQRTITSEPCLAIKNDKDNTIPGLFMCALEQFDHFTNFNLSVSDDMKQLDNIQVECTFDEIQIDPGSEMATSWIYFSECEDEGDSLREYVNLVAEEHKIPQPAPPPAFYCSWYYYTLDFTEEDLEKNCKIIKEKSLPLDVFIIDNGWMDNFGDYNSNHRFPKGMKHAADVIRDAGMEPAIWSVPFIYSVDSDIAKKYPDMQLLEKDGKPAIYPNADSECYLVDPSAPSAKEFIFDIFSKLKKWGYKHHKLDYLRCIVLNKNVQFRDRRVNRVRAYRMLLSYVREALGDDAYIIGCGGVYDTANIGLLDSYRTSRDVRGHWADPEGDNRNGALIQIKQNILRNYTGRFWHTDPDATMIRIRPEKYKSDERKRNNTFLSLGLYTDDEAETIITNHYLGGGVVNVSECIPELQESRLKLLSHVIPTTAPGAKILDYHSPDCPSIFLTDVTASCKTMKNWWTLTVGNWEEKCVSRKMKLSEIRLPDNIERFAVFEFFTQKFIGIKTKNDFIESEIPAHGVRVFRIMEWNGKTPAIVGTDLHITGGACEIANFAADENSVSGEIKTDWQYPVVITVAFPQDVDNVKIITEIIPAGDKTFNILRTES